MCDTLGKLGQTLSLFAKNSDRSPNEAQIAEFHPAAENLSGTVNCTYISIPQAERTYAVLLSRPVWMWGAEMGVNEFGLCIGNEAVFTKGSYGKTGLTGMDMVRLALERCKSAKEALDLLIELLETYGQGGNCGYDHDFYYDNAFLLMDRSELYVLETAGKQWSWKRSNHASISNRLSLGTDADACAGGEVYDFKKKYLEPVYSFFSGSARRRQQTGSCLENLKNVRDCMAALSQHRKGVSPFVEGSVSSVCMHYGGLVGDHTTASMVVALEKDRIVVWFTGSSCPCVSLFKPWIFGTEPVLPVVSAGDKAGERYWRDAEYFRRKLLGRELPEKYYEERAELQNRWIAQTAEMPADEFAAFSDACLEQERTFFEAWNPEDFESCRCGGGFRSRWEKKSKVLFTDRK